MFLFLPFIVSLIEIGKTSTNVDISQALNDVKEGKISEVLVQNEKLVLKYVDGSTRFSVKESTESFSELLSREGIEPSKVKYKVVDQSFSKTVIDILSTILPVILFAVLFLFIIKAQNRAAGDIFSFGKSRAKIFAKGKQNVTFADVAGVDDAKKELEEVVDFLKTPKSIGKLVPALQKEFYFLDPLAWEKLFLLVL